MPDGGSLTVTTEKVLLDDDFCRLHVGANPGEYALLAVSDTGNGMTKETLEHIFEPFFTTKEMGRGTGLGLAMVHGIVNRHNGYITCESEIGRGTTFKTYLPAIPTDQDTEDDISGRAAAFGTETILLVDDEEFVRDLGARILTRYGYTVLQAANGKEAIEVFREKGPEISLVILDLIMPEMSGSECMEQLLKIDPKAGIVLSSGYSADSPMGESVEMGARGFVQKPFRMRDLLQEVRRVLDKT
jgi:CheY-like chemotaxis protein